MSMYRKPPPPLPLFDQADLREGLARKEAALEGHETNYPDRLEDVRDYLRELAKDGREMTSDHAKAWVDANGVERGPWMGGIFRGREWVSVGVTPSKDPKQHGALIRVWRLRSTLTHEDTR